MALPLPNRTSRLLGNRGCGNNNSEENEEVVADACDDASVVEDFNSRKMVLSEPVLFRNGAGLHWIPSLLMDDDFFGDFVGSSVGAGLVISPDDRLAFRKALQIASRLRLSWAIALLVEGLEAWFSLDLRRLGFGPLEVVAGDCLFVPLAAAASFLAALAVFDDFNDSPSPDCSCKEKEEEELLSWT